MILIKENRILKWISEIQNEIILASIVFVLFFINIQDSSPLTLVKKIIFLTICIVIYIKHSLKLGSWKAMIMPMTIVLISLIHYKATAEQYFLVDGLTLISIYFIQRKDFEISDSKGLRTFEFLTLITIYLNLLYFRFNGRSTIGGIDPNFSSLLIFLFLVYLIKIKRSKYLISICLIAGLMTLSRTYFVAIILLTIFSLIKNRKILLTSFLLLPFFFLLTLHAFTYRDLYKNFQPLHDFSEFLYFSSNEHTNPLRIIHFIGNTSDNVRADANMKTFHKMKEDKHFLFYGENPEKFEVKNGFKMAHNYFLFQLSQSGILLGVIAISIFYLICIKSFFSTNCHILIGYCSYIAFLGIETGSIYTVFLVMILKLRFI